METPALCQSYVIFCCINITFSRPSHHLVDEKIKIGQLTLPLPLREQVATSGGALP